MSKPAKLLIGASVFLLTGFFAQSALAAETRTPSQAAFQIQAENGLLNLGAAFVGKEVLPAPAQLGSTNIPNWWDIVDSVAAIGSNPAIYNICTNPNAFAGGSSNNVLFPCGANPSYATIRGTNTASSNWNPTTGEIVLDAVLPAVGTPWSEAFNRDIRFPVMQVPSPTTGNPVPLTLVASGPVSGSYNSATGDLSLSPDTGSSFEARVLVGLGIPTAAGGPQPFTYCKVPLPEMTLSSASGAFPGTPFLSGLGGSGALQGSYTISENSIPVTQAGLSPTAAAAASSALGQCAGAVDLVIKGSGALWLGNRVPVPACAAGQIGSYPDCQNPQANISKIVLQGPRSVSVGKKLKLSLRVTNSGSADETVRLALFSSSGRARVPANVSLLVPADTTARKQVVVRTKSRGKVVISATTGGITGKKKLRIN